MKKILCVLFSILLLTGCSSSTKDTFMLLSENGYYELYNEEGKQLSEDNYISYVKNDSYGYIVETSEGLSYINNKGKTVIDAGTHSFLTIVDQMVIGSEEELLLDATVQEITIYSSEGDELYSGSYTINSLPIIVEDDEYIVLYSTGEELYRGESGVNSVAYSGDVYALSLEDTIIIEHTLSDTSYSIERSGDYDILDNSTDKVLLYDENENEVIYVSVSEETYFVYDSFGFDEIYFDDHDNIIVEVGTTTSLLSKSKNNFITLNTYYRSSKNYLIRGSDLYGPHTLVSDGEEIEISDCELEPLPTLFTGDLYPVYIEDSGYVYYNMEGEHAFSTVFTYAGLYDENGLAIVSEEENSYYLIDSENNQITDDTYLMIEYIGSSYYVVYNDSGAYGIIDTNGDFVLDIQFTDNYEQKIYTYEGNNYLLVEKNGMSYLYDLESLEVILSIEETITFNEEGYLTAGEYQYYTLEGDIIQ